MTQRFTIRPELRVRFWGVRGCVACPGPATIRYGGNTPCVEVRCGDRIIIFDGGTGLRPLGDALNGTKLDLDILLSHGHLDHVAGLPFFAPLFAEGHDIRIWAASLTSVSQIVGMLLGPPLFPLGATGFRANVAYHDFSAGATIDIGGGIAVRTAPLDHPDGAAGYRLDCNGKSVAYVTDIELHRDALDPSVVSLARECDLLIFDCTYTQEEIVSRRGWGHSTWNDGIRLANAAGAKSLCLFHHAPAHDDAAMDAIGALAQAARPGTIVAYEGLVIDL